jgi:hypothetical protein
MLGFELTFEEHRSLAQYRGRTGRMPEDLDHEVIDSPRALFRHLYEAHGLVEALDLDPDTAPLQFWLRRHAELERAATRAAAQQRTPAQDQAAARDRTPPVQDRLTPPQERLTPAQDRLTPQQDRVAAAQHRVAAAQHRAGPLNAGASRRHSEPDRPETPGRPAAAHGPPSVGRDPAADRPGSTGRPAEPDRLVSSGPRFRPFADPLVEALAAALVGRGLDERRVRRGLSTFTGADGRHGEEAVRAAFLEPMLEAVAAHLAGDAKGPARGAQPSPGPAPPDPRPRESFAARAEPPGVGQEEAWVAQPLAARGPGPEPEVDFMAIADVLQERRRSRRGGRRDATSRSTPPNAPLPGTTAPASKPASPQEPDDDYMALANALQRRRGNRPH